uniref:F-box domain-containing protein n=1 Tax=Pristionchus pacificus TaxID=54126 RepID=A0A8R1YA13_PRIPA
MSANNSLSDQIRSLHMVTLDSIPSDALGHILYFANLQDRLNVRRVCRALEEGVSRTIWHNFKPNSCKLEDLELKELPWPKPSSKSKPLGFLTVRIGRLSKDYRLQEKAEFPRFLERLGCGLRVSRVVLCGMTFNTSGTIFIESILKKNMVFKSMELVVCRRTQIRTPSQASRVCAKAQEQDHRVDASGRVVDEHLPALAHVSTIGRVAKPFVIDDETFLRMVDAQRVLMLKRGKVELTEHGLLAAFLAIADNPQPQYVEITVELMTAIKFMYFFGSELTWDGFMPSNQDYVHVFVKRCRKKGRTESLLVTIVNHRRSSIFLQTPVSQSLTEDTIAEIYNEPHMLARGNPWIFHSS